MATIMSIATQYSPYPMHSVPCALPTRMGVSRASAAQRVTSIAHLGRRDTQPELLKQTHCAVPAFA